MYYIDSNTSSKMTLTFSPTGLDSIGNKDNVCNWKKQASNKERKGWEQLNN